MRVLLIEDNPDAQNLYKRVLSAAGIMVDATDSGEEGIELAKLYDFDLVLLDLGLPDMSGNEVIRCLRLAKLTTPILVLTGDANLEMKLASFGLGADGYLTKPFPKSELIARIQSIVRRSSGHAQPVIQVGQLVVNTDQKSVQLDGETIRLMPKEYQILEVLTLRLGATVTKETLLNNLYSGIDEPSGKIIDVFMCKLRKKLSTASGKKSYIETIRGRGYLLRDPNMKAPE